MRGRVWTLGLVVLLLIASVAPAHAEERVVIRFEPPMEVVDMLTELATTLDLPLVWDPKARGLQNRHVVGDLRFEGTRAEILEAVRSMLMFYELVVIPVGEGANQRLLIADARQSAVFLKLKPVYVDITDENVDALDEKDGLFVTTTIPTEHLESLRDARNALNRIVTGQNVGSVTEVPAARSFVVTDFAPNVAAIYRLLKRMDVPSDPDTGREVVFRAFRLKHAPALQTTSTLVQHFATAGPPPAASARRTSPQPAPSEVPPLPPLRIHADARLNQVLVSGTRKDVDDVAAVIATLDLPLPRAETSIQYVRLAHRDARSVASMLAGIIAGSPSLWTEGSGGTTRPAVQPDAEGEALLLHASEPVLSTLRRLIAEIDTPLTAAEEPGDE